MLILLLVPWIFLAVSQCFAGDNFCVPFRVHTHATLPPPPSISVPLHLPENWEEDLPNSISKIKTQESFSKAYKVWRNKNPEALNDSERFQWLQCLLYYVKMDTNGNGIPDWNALVDNQPTHVLYPADEDMDGDGVPNILDPDPLNPLVDGRLGQIKGEIPAHLKFDSVTRPKASQLQRELYGEFGILAIDHTDQHSPQVLEELLFVLRQGLSHKTVASLKDFRFLYAFAGHDASGKVASFHREARAISVGGTLVYSKSLTLSQRVELYGALAHEIGHAFLFEKMSPSELRKLGEYFGGWGPVFNGDDDGSFYSKVFFLPHPFLKQPASWARNNITSSYATTNMHEWFAEAFAANILKKLGRKSPFLTSSFLKWFRSKLTGFSLNDPVSNLEHKE